MDRSRTEVETSSQGNVNLLTELLNIITTIRPGAPPAEQVKILLRTIACANDWCPVSTWGVKKITEHLDERRKAFFGPHITVSMTGFGSLRAAPLLAPITVNDPRLYVDDTLLNRQCRSGRRMDVFLFVAENAHIIAVRALSDRSGDEVLPAHEVEVLWAPESFLIDLIQHPRGGKANATLVTDAMRNLSQILYWAQRKAQERVVQLGQGHNAMEMIRCLIHMAWTPPP